MIIFAPFKNVKQILQLALTTVIKSPKLLKTAVIKCYA
jgi:hypothetical protein